MKPFVRSMRGYWWASAFFVMLVGVCGAQKVAITFDDLPLNGDLPPGMTRVDITRNTLAVLQKRHMPAAYGFVNAKKLEGNADAAEALKLWAAAEPVGNHTYSHMDLNEILRRRLSTRSSRMSRPWNCSPRRMETGTGCGIRICARETPSRNGARCGPICWRTSTGWHR